jgi:hypothetical protein
MCGCDYHGNTPWNHVAEITDDKLVGLGIGSRPSIKLKAAKLHSRLYCLQQVHGRSVEIFVARLSYTGAFQQ